MKIFYFFIDIVQYYNINQEKSRRKEKFNIFLFLLKSFTVAEFRV